MQKSETRPDEQIYQRYEPVIGLEVHCQLKTKAKLFCSCATRFGDLPNHQTCAVCGGHPGSLPSLNEEAVKLAVRMALALRCDIHETSVFARKQYFYPDLPKGYQITQYERPFCTGGSVTLQSGKAVKLTRIHIEEDAGKSVHGEQFSYVDFNRAGVPLIEIVTDPILSSVEEASEYLKRLRTIARHIDVSDGNMEEGSFRCDANISLRRKGEKRLGVRCEIKNLNSFRNVERAIAYEILRQADLIDAGQTVSQETRQFDPASGKTNLLRSKEDSEDYRYFPEPDLNPLYLSEDFISEQRSRLPELPEEMATRFIATFGLSSYDAALICADKDLADYFTEAANAAGGVGAGKLVANWILTEVLAVMSQESGFDHPPLSAAILGELVSLIVDETISGKLAKKIFPMLLQEKRSPRELVKELGLTQVVDEATIRSAVVAVLDLNEAQVQEYLSGKDKVQAYFIGQIMRNSGGKLNPALVTSMLKSELEKRRR